MRRRISLPALVSVAALATPGWAGINQWTAIGPEGALTSIVRFDASSPSTVYAVSAGLLYRSTD